MPATPTFVFAGGGTGGHLFPAIALAHELESRADGARIQFVGSARPAERQILAPHGYDHVPLALDSPAALRRRPARFLWKLAFALRTSRRLLREWTPAAVFGMGGYISAPVVVAARRAGIPVLLLEQNAVPGRATCWLGRYASVTCLSYAEASASLNPARRVVVTGNPVRREIAVLHGQAVDEQPRPTLLVLGGSLGARSLNQMVIQATALLSPQLRHWKILHQTGPDDVDVVERHYRSLGFDAETAPFFTDLQSRYAQATVVVSRAGGTTLAELACAGCPSILVPYPHATDDHQSRNAAACVARGGAVLVPDDPETDVAGSRLAQALERLVVDPDQRARARRAMLSLAVPDATQRVLAELDRLLAQTGRR